MKITKIITCDVDLMSPAEIYSPDLTNLLLEKMKKKLELKCYRQFYILKILRVINHGVVQFPKDRVDGSGFTSVQMEVEGLVYIKMELIPSVTINSSPNLSESSLHFSNQYVKGLMQIKQDVNRAFMNAIPDKHQIPVIVSETSYNPGFSAVTVIGVPFSPQEFAENPILFVCSNKKTETFEKEGSILPFLKMLKDELALHRDLKKEERYKFFSEIIYPYKQNLSNSAIAADIKYVTLDDASKENNVEFVYSMFEYHTLESFEKIPIKKSETKESKYTIHNIDAVDALKFIITRRLIYLNALRGLVESYTFQQATKLVTYWQTYKNHKLVLD